jgi:hypothetical protein
MNFPSRLHLKSKFLALTMMVGSASSATFTYTPVNAGDKADLLPGMSLEQVNFAGGEFGTTGTTYPAVNFDAYKAESTGVQLLFSIPEGSYRLDMPQGVDACYGVKWVAPEGQVFTNLNIELLNEGLNDTPFQGSAYSVSNGTPTLLGSWGKGGVTPGTGGSFVFNREQNVTEIRVYALDARLGTTENGPFPNVFRAWNGDMVGIGSIQVATAAAPARQAPVNATRGSN